MSTAVAVIESDSVVASMTRASYALAEAVTVSQTKKIIDVARAAEIYAKRQHLSEDAISQATSVKIEAMRKLGEILRETPKATAFLGGTKKEPTRNDAPTLDDLGLTKKESAVAQKLAGLTDEAFEQVRDGSVTISKAIAAVEEHKARKTRKAKPTARAEIIKEELNAARDRGESMLLIFGRQLLRAIGATESINDEERDLLTQIESAINLKVLCNEN